MTPIRTGKEGGGGGRRRREAIGWSGAVTRKKNNMSSKLQSYSGRASVCVCMRVSALSRISLPKRLPVRRCVTCSGSWPPTWPASTLPGLFRSTLSLLSATLPPCLFTSRRGAEVGGGGSALLSLHLPDPRQVCVSARRRSPLRVSRSCLCADRRLSGLLWQPPPRTLVYCLCWPTPTSQLLLSENQEAACPTYAQPRIGSGKGWRGDRRGGQGTGGGKHRGPAPVR